MWHIFRGQARTYRAIKHVGSFDRVWGNRAKYDRAGGAKLCAKIILTRVNMREAQEFMQKVEEAGIKRVIADVDYHCDFVPDEQPIPAAALLGYECRSKGIMFETHPGTELTSPEKHFKKQSDENVPATRAEAELGLETFLEDRRGRRYLRPINGD